MKKVNDILPDALVGKEVLKAAKAQSVLREWKEIVGGILATKTTVIRYDHGILWIEAEGSAWAQEMQLNSEIVLARLNQAAGQKNLFEKIRIGTRRP